MKSFVRDIQIKFKHKNTLVAAAENPNVTGTLIKQSRLHKPQTNKKSFFVQHCCSPTFNIPSIIAQNEASWEVNRHGGRSYLCK